MRKIVFFFLLIFLCSCDSDPKVLNATNLLSLPDSNSNVVAQIPQNADSTLIFKIYNWCYIEYEEKKGFVMCSDLDLPPTINGALSGKNVIVDAGHGGKDNGAMVDNIKEKDINRNVSDYLIQDLLAQGANVFDVRKNDETLYLYDRPLLTNLFLLSKLYIETTDADVRLRLSELILDLEGYLEKNQKSVPDLFKKGDDMSLDLQTLFELTKDIDDTVFASIHSNVSGNADVELQGLDIILSGNDLANLYPGYEKYDDKERLLFGELLGEKIPLATDMNLRRIYFGDYAVLREQNLPSALIELGYMDNKDDLKFLLDKENQKNYAKGITDAIITYFHPENPK